MRAIVRGVRENFAVATALVTVVGLVFRLIYVATVKPHTPMGMDAAWYVVEGHVLAGGRGYIDPRVYLLGGADVPTANFPPLWPLVLALADRVGLNTADRNAIIGPLLGGATVAVTAVLGRRVAGPMVGIVAAAFVACSPMLIAADGSLMAESLFVLLVTAAVLAVYRALDRPGVGRFAVVGLLVGLAMITRSDGLFLVPTFGFVLWWRLGRLAVARRLALGAVALGVCVVPTLVFDAYSSARMGGLVVATSNSGNMLSGANCPSTYSGKLIGAWDERCANNLAAGVDELTWVRGARSQGLDYAKGHVTRLPLVASARVLRTWGLWDPVQMAHLESVETRNVTWQIIGWGFDMMLLVGAVAGTVILRRRRATVAPMVAVVLSVVVTAALSNGNQRFRLSVEPVLAVAAAVAAVAVGAAVRCRREEQRSGARGRPEDRLVDRS